VAGKKMTLVRFCKKLQLSVWFQFYKINCSFVLFRFGFSTFTCQCHLSCMPQWCMTLEMTYFHAELVQLIVRRSHSELEVQREIRHEDKYFESLTVDPIMLEDEL